MAFKVAAAFLLVFTLIAVHSKEATAANSLKITSKADIQGKQLRGVNRSGGEYSCINGFGILEGPTDDAAIQAMKNWKINTVRIPLNEECWLGLNKKDKAYTGKNYRNAIIDYVTRLRNNDMNVILDLHWTRGNYTGVGAGCSVEDAKCQKAMPDKQYAPRFWQSVANNFKKDTGVIFDLFNEPFPDMVLWDRAAAWKCWRDGGSACPGFGFEVAGMQDLMTAVRSTGARNLVMVGGVHWGGDLGTPGQGWLDYRPGDPYNNIAASWHSYNFGGCNNTECWETKVAPVAAKYPVITGEIGQTDCKSDYIESLMSWLDQRNASYVAWTWNTWGCKDGPALISNYDGTPNDFGKGYMAHLQKLA